MTENFYIVVIINVTLLLSNHIHKILAIRMVVHLPFGYKVKECRPINSIPIGTYLLAVGGSLLNCCSISLLVGAIYIYILAIVTTRVLVIL